MLRTLHAIALSLLGVISGVAADNVSEFATGLQFLVKLLLADQGNFLVSEIGPGLNTAVSAAM